MEECGKSRKDGLERLRTVFFPSDGDAWPEWHFLEWVGPLKSHPRMRRWEGNPIFSSLDVPYESSLAFNAGVAKFRSKYYMVFRNDVRHPNDPCVLSHFGTGFAVSKDGIKWEVFEKEIRFHWKGGLLTGVIDARLTELDGKLFLSFCFNSIHGERPGYAVWSGGVDFEVKYLGIPAQRNMILCSGRVRGRYWRLERPVTRRNVYDIWVSYSEDLEHWGDAELLLGVEDVPFANVKIGGGPPPILTPHGYILLFHAVDDDDERLMVYKDGSKWKSRYTVGAALLDSKDPGNVTAITREPILVPEAEYETGNTEVFWRENVVFPCGALLEESGDLRIYYGAGDYSVCMARMSVADILSAMTPYRRIAETATISELDLL